MYLNTNYHVFRIQFSTWRSLETKFNFKINKPRKMYYCFVSTIFFLIVAVLSILDKSERVRNSMFLLVLSLGGFVPWCIFFFQTVYSVIERHIMWTFCRYLSGNWFSLHVHKIEKYKNKQVVGCCFNIFYGICMYYI